MATVTSLLFKLEAAKERVTRIERITALQRAIVIAILIGDDRIPFLLEINPIGDDAVFRPDFRRFDPILLFESHSHFGRFCSFDSGIEHKHLTHLYTVSLEMKFDLIARGCW